VLELARLIGYELAPGVAANAYLAFTLEDAAGALGQVLAVGTTAQAAPEGLPPITIDTVQKCKAYLVRASRRRLSKPFNRSKRAPNGTRSSHD
jgi:hypothetical protein